MTTQQPRTVDSILLVLIPRYEWRAAVQTIEGLFQAFAGIRNEIIDQLSGNRISL